MQAPFVVTADGTLCISEAAITESRLICPGLGLGLSESFGEEAQKQADLLERRLSRIEQTLGLGPICAG